MHFGVMGTAGEVQNIFLTQCSLMTQEGLIKIHGVPPVKPGSINPAQAPYPLYHASSTKCIIKIYSCSLIVMFVICLYEKVNIFIILNQKSN